MFRSRILFYHSLVAKISFPVALAKMQRLAQMGAKIPFVHLHETFNNWPLCHPHNLPSFSNRSTLSQHFITFLATIRVI